MFRDVPLFGTMQCKKICGNSLLTRQLRIMIHGLIYLQTQNGGKFVYDAVPHIFYRIHDDNTSGFSTNKIHKLLNGLNKYLGAQHPRRDVFAKMILDNYSELIDQNSMEYKNLCIVRDYKKSFLNKIELCRSSELPTYSFKSKVFSVLCIALGRW